jgi:hypothetical protein
MPALRIKKLSGMVGLARFELATTGLGISVFEAGYSVLFRLRRSHSA